MGKISQEEQVSLLEPGNSDVLNWPVSASYLIFEGSIHPDSDELRRSWPLSKPSLYLSFSRLGSRGEPTGNALLDWVSRHGLLRREGPPPEPDGPEVWLEPASRRARWDEVRQAPATLEEIREEVRTFRQLLSLYTDVRGRNGAAVTERFLNPTAPWPRTPPTLVDRYFARYAAIGEKYRRQLEEAGVDSHSQHLKLGLDVVRRVINAKLGPRSQTLLGWVWDPMLPASSTSVGLVRWQGVPDLLSAMYLQLHALVSHNLPMRRCESPICFEVFPVTRSHKQYCNDTCRSNARHYRDKAKA